MQLLEFMRPFDGDMSKNPPPKVAALAYEALVTYIHDRHWLNTTVQLSIDPGLQDLFADLNLDAEGTITTLQVHTFSDTGQVWQSAHLYVPEGKHTYTCDPEHQVVRRIDRLHEAQILMGNVIDEATASSGLLGGLTVFKQMLDAAGFDEEQGLNNQPVDRREIGGLIAFCDRGIPIAPPS